MKHNSRMGALISAALESAAAESDIPADNIDAKIGNPEQLDTIVAEGGELDRPAMVSVEEADLSADVVEAEVALDDGNAAVDQLQSGERTFNRAAEIAESSLADGGMQPATAEALQVAVDNTREALGIEEPVGPATESYGSESNRYHATVAALESFRDTAKRVGDAIMAAIERVKQFLKDLFTKLIEFVFSLKGRNKTLRKKIDGAKGKKMPTDLLKLGSVAERVDAGGKKDTDLLDEVVSLCEQASKFDGDFMTGLKADYDAIKAAATAGKADAVGSAIAREPSIPNGFGNKTENGANAGGHTEHSTKLLPGNVRFAIVRNSVSHTGSLSERAGKVVSNLMRRFEADWKVIRIEEDKKQAAGELTPMSLGECEQVYKAVEKLAGMEKTAVSKKNAAELSFSKVEIKKDADPKDAAEIRQAMTRFASRIGTANQATAKLMAHAGRTAAAYQTWALKSLDAYTG